MQRIGIYFNACTKISAAERVRLLSKHGFATTFLDGHDPEIGERMSLLREANILCENCHAPFDGINAMWRPTEDGEVMLARLLASLENCARYEIPVMVTHLSAGNTPPRYCEIGQMRYDALMARARELGVTIAFENQRKLGNIALAMEDYPDAGFCFDTGHEFCFTGGREYMPLFGDRIVALHLHDNSTEWNADQHLIPYDGKVDLERAARHLAASPYDRSIMSESVKSAFYDHLTEDAFYARAAEAIHRFADRVAYYRQNGK